MIIKKEHAPGLILPVYAATQQITKPHSRVCSIVIKTYGATQVEAMMKCIEICTKTGVKL